MASNRIKGLTIELDGDTSGLNHSLKEVDKSLKSTQASLKDVNKLLKLDPKNTELLRQKQELLSKSIKDTGDRLSKLKDAYKQLDGKNTQEAKEQQKILAREIAETENNLKSLKNEYKNFGSVAAQQIKNVGEKMKDVGSAMQTAGTTLTAAVTAPIIALGTMGLSYNAQMEQYKVLFTTLTGSAEEADRVISQLQADAQKSPFDSASLIKANQYLISAGVSADVARQDILNLGNAIAATGGGSSELERMAQNMQQIKNVGKATAQDIKQFANAGINIYGLLADATGKTIEEVKDMDVSYEVLSSALAKASGEGGQFYGAMEAQSQTLNGSLSATKESIQQLVGEITEAVLPVIVDVLNYVKGIIDSLKGMDSSTKKTILIVAGIAAAIGPLLMGLGSLIVLVGQILTFAPVVIGALSAVTAPMLLIPAAIAAVVAAGIWLIKNWDLVKEKAAEVWTKVKNDWQEIVDFFKEKIDMLVEKFVNFKNAIVEAFSFDNIKGKISSLFSKIGGFFSGGSFSSGGFGNLAMASGGYMSGGSVNVYNTFNLSAANIDRRTAYALADMITDRVNENLGRMV